MIDNEQVSLAMIFCHPNLKEDYHPGLLNPAKIFWLKKIRREDGSPVPIAGSLLNPLLCPTSGQGLKGFQEWTAHGRPEPCPPRILKKPVRMLDGTPVGTLKVHRPK